MLDSNNSSDKNNSGSEEKKEVPAGGNAGETNKNTEALSNLPEALKGKSPQEITEMYVNLEKKMGEQSTTVAEAQKIKEQTDTLLRAIWADPDLYRAVDNGIKKYATGEIIPETRKTEKKGDEEAKGIKVDPMVTDVRVAQENQILDGFYTKYGYKNLSEKDRKDSLQRLAMAVGELVDPGGTRPIKEILASIPLTKLPRYLENAHFIANKEQVVAQAKRSALLDNQTNEDAAIGSFATSKQGSASQGVTLTNAERETAKNLGIPEEKFIKKKAQIIEERKHLES